LGLKEDILFLEIVYFFILGGAAKLRWVGGGAQRPVGSGSEPKKKGARTRGQNPLVTKCSQNTVIEQMVPVNSMVQRITIISLKQMVFIISIEQMVPINSVEQRISNCFTEADGSRYYC
jgi:hypothetical protein